MRLRRRATWVAAGLACATAGCASILGDFATDGADAAADAGGEGGDGSRPGHDGAVDIGPDGACAAGATRCPAGCVALDAATACGACGHDCLGGSCAAGSCGPYVIARQPTTGTVARLATDGTRVVWSDTGMLAIEQIATNGGPPIVLAPSSSTQGAVGSELALAGSTVAFVYLGVSAPSVGLATVDVADSGTSAIPGALQVNALALNPSATHVFFVDVTGTQGSLDDCSIAGRDAGTCIGVVGGGRFLGQTAADDGHLLFDLTGANVQSPGLYLDIASTGTTTMFAVDVAQSLALDGKWAYWTISEDGGATYTIRRTLEVTPTIVAQTVASNLASSAFATDGLNVYYWTGAAVVSRPVAGGAETALAPASRFVQIAVGGGVLVWTDGATIWGLVLSGR